MTPDQKDRILLFLHASCLAQRLAFPIHVLAFLRGAIVLEGAWAA